jgi:16S rRNA (guanine966-N2)-methyltransferase
VFVETAAASRAAIRANIEAFGVGGVTKLLKRDATDLGPATPATSGCTLAFLDPPYGKGLAPLALAELGNHGWLADGAVAVIEEDASATSVLPESFEEIDSRTYGGTRVTFARWTATRA